MVSGTVPARFFSCCDIVSGCSGCSSESEHLVLELLLDLGKFLLSVSSCNLAVCLDLDDLVESSDELLGGVLECLDVYDTSLACLCCLNCALVECLCILSEHLVGSLCYSILSLDSLLCMIVVQSQYHLCLTHRNYIDDGRVDLLGHDSV